MTRLNIFLKGNNHDLLYFINILSIYFYYFTNTFLTKYGFRLLVREHFHSNRFATGMSKNVHDEWTDNLDVEEWSRPDDWIDKVCSQT